MIFAIQNICAKNSQTKSKDKASIGQHNKPSVMGMLQNFTCLQLGKKEQMIIIICSFFCQIQKYLKLIKVHSLVYKWFFALLYLHTEIFLHAEGHVHKTRQKGSFIRSEPRKKVIHKSNNSIRDSVGTWLMKRIKWAIISLHFASNGQPACLEDVLIE